jgi:hypothetical protein
MAACSKLVNIQAMADEILIVRRLLRARPLSFCSLLGRLRHELRRMDSLRSFFDLLVLLIVDALARFKFCWCSARRLEAVVLENLGRREVDVEFAAALAL